MSASPQQSKLNYLSKYKYANVSNFQELEGILKIIQFNFFSLQMEGQDQRNQTSLRLLNW